MEDDGIQGVRIERIDGCWAVFVVENGEISERRFDLEEFAVNFAHGQAARLGVTIRIVDQPGDQA